MSEIDGAQELTVITKARDLCGYIMTVTDRAPKKFRFTFVQRMQNLSIDIIENLFRANQIFVRSRDDTGRMRIRMNYQNDAYVDAKLLSYLALISMESGCLLPKQYEQITRKTSEVMKLTIMWSRSDKERYARLR